MSFLSPSPALTFLSVALLGGAVAPPAGGQEVVDLPGRDTPLRVSFTPLHQVGGPDAAWWSSFVRLDGAAFGRDGRLYLLDGRAPAVVTVGSDGELLHRLGGTGDGPGEYRSPSGVVALPDGRVVVWDQRKRAFLVYGPDGEHLEEIRGDYREGLPDGPFALAAAGDTPPVLVFLPAQLVTGRLGRAWMSGEGFHAAEGRLPLLRTVLADGAPVEAVTRVRLAVPEGPGPHSVLRAFEPEPTWGVLEGGRVALHDDDRYRIRIVGPDGSVERVLTRPIPPRPTTDADRRAFDRSVADRVVHSLGQPGGGGTGARPSDPLYHPVVPPVRRITTDGVATIWVERRHPDDPTRPGPVDVLDASGRYLGTLPPGAPGLPAAFGPDGRVVVLATDELEVPVARVYELERGSGLPPRR